MGGGEFLKEESGFLTSAVNAFYVYLNKKYYIRLDSVKQREGQLVFMNSDKILSCLGGFGCCTWL